MLAHLPPIAFSTLQSYEKPQTPPSSRYNSIVTNSRIYENIITIIFGSKIILSAKVIKGGKHMKVFSSTGDNLLYVSFSR